MNYYKSALLFAIGVFFLLRAGAQFQGNVYQQRFTSPKVFATTNDTLINPWMGGLNSVQVQHADLNNDGKKDVVIFDQPNNKIQTFLNTGGSNQSNYIYTPKYALNFPTVDYYLILKDYNCDNIPDLFHKGLSGVEVWKGKYVNNELKFDLYKSLYYPTTGTNIINVYVQPTDIPSIEDLDSDGDLDILSFDIFGGKIIYYQNLRVENAMPCDSIYMVIGDNCWGKVAQGLPRAYFLNTACKVTETDDDTGSEDADVNARKKRHAGNCTCAVDIDGDNDYDLLSGNISYDDQQFLHNGGDAINALIDWQDTLWQQSGTALYLPQWPCAFKLDVDNDGDFDILFGSHMDAYDQGMSQEGSKIILYKNIGSNATPNYVHFSDKMFLDEMLEWGAYSYPAVFDYNKDGLIDVVLGNEGFFDSTDRHLKGKIMLLKNVSDSNTKFQFDGMDWLNLSVNKYEGVYPAFGDVSGDGVSDLLIGHNNGRVSFYKNMALTEAALPNFQLQTDSFAQIKITSGYSTPFVFDVNGDGKNEIFVGSKKGYIYRYNNNGSITSPVFDLVDSNYGNVIIGTNNIVYGYSNPKFFVTDDSNKYYMVSGTGDGTIERYRGFDIYQDTLLRLDSFYSNIQTLTRSAPVFADFNKDGWVELLCGQKTGGLLYYNQVVQVGDTNIAIGIPPIRNGNYFTVFPNPTTASVFVQPSENSNEPFQFVLTDMNGKIVSDSKFNTTKNEKIILDLPKGVYFYRIYFRNKLQSGKIIKL